MIPDRDLTDDVLDEIIAGAKTSMEQYLALSLKAEREVWRKEGPTDDERIMAIEGIHNCERCGDEGWVVSEMGIMRCACGQTRNSPAIPDCWCRTCRPVVLNDMRFVVCPDCGNKRCPRANDHRNACTGSNEPGQEGSAYPAAPQPQNAPQNIPEIIPNELIAAVNRLLDSNGSRGCYNAIKCYDAHIEVELLLAAARQEVK